MANDRDRPPEGRDRLPEGRDLNPGGLHRRYCRWVQFSRELRDDVLAGRITVSYRLWHRPKVRVGGRYPVGPAQFEVDSVELVPFSVVTPDDVRRSGEPDRESLRRRAAHAGPIGDDTLVYRIEFHIVETPSTSRAAPENTA